MSQVVLFSTLAVVSLLFVFGTPLYAILFFGIPGFNQLHTPFRWVFPYTLSMAMLAGIGIEYLQQHGLPEFSRLSRLSRFSRLFAWTLVAIGTAILAALAASWLLRDQTLAFLDRLVQSSDLARKAFDGGRMFYSYEFRNILLFAIFLIGAGAIFRIARSPIYLPARLGRTPLWQVGTLALVIVELFVIGFDFYPKSDARLKDFTPPAVKFLRQDTSLYRITSYDRPDEKVFNANVGMFYGIQDIRGYDSIIPKPYADLMNLIAPQDELLYNRIAAFYNPESLSSPLINLLNVKYILTTRPVPNAGYSLAYDGADLKIYRNDRVLPRAFMVPQARVIADRAELLDALKTLDPARQVLIEEQNSQTHTLTNFCAYSPVEISKYAGSEVILKSNQPCGGWLVLSDAYFNGWLAQIDGADTHLYRADYNFRAVYVPAGAHTIRFRYSPISFRVGAIGSFLGAMVLLLAGALLVWQRFYRAETQSHVSIVAKNSLLPMATSLLMKFLTLAFALVSLRILGPTGTGRYAFAVTIWFFADTITDFGLGILLTREVARDKTQANRLLTNSAILRVLLWTLSLVPITLVTAIYVFFFNLSLDTVVALALLMVGILPSTLAGSLAFLFNAYERFEYRIAVDFAMKLLSIALGVVALVLGYGFVGLAVVSIIVNLCALTTFYFLVRHSLFSPRLQFDRGLMRWMFFESFPLMFNNLLSSFFFRIDALILQPLKGDTVLGYYNTAYKFIDALNFIPSNFTLAIFPALSRLAADQKEAMRRAFILALKLLLWISLPITVGTMFLAIDLIRIFGGDEFLPHSAIALQVLIWFLPFSFVNSVTHYVLIALGQQRFLTKAFVAGVVFNVVGNIIVIPYLSYVGSALVTILSEIVLLVPFFYAARKNLAPISLLAIFWRPALASALMGGALWLLVPRIGIWFAIPVAGVIYGVLLLLVGALGTEERALVRKLLPGGVKRLLKMV
ncbi:MAG: oligosaccharide flippase family protein [Chloroflexi bacterium]|nr:oligosaccharide flippase family protein [Chloroflexota bacterium]